MVRVRYTALDDGSHTLSLLGHAGFAEHGKDIVCAGISAIVQALMGWVLEHEEADPIISIDEKKGDVRISCGYCYGADAVFSMALIGLEGISESYPDHIQIENSG